MCLHRKKVGLFLFSFLFSVSRNKNDRLQSDQHNVSTTQLILCIMAPTTFRNMATILILCSVLTSALCCDWLTHYNDLRNSSLVLVRSMKCPIATTTHLRFRDSLYKVMKTREENSQLRFIRCSLAHIYNLYRHGNTSAACWDAGKTTNFLESINRQILELDECVKSTHNKTTSKRYEVYEKQLKRYYRKLENNTLLHPGGTDGWEMLRRETEQDLIRLDQLGNRIKARRGQH
ncbi:interferon a3-like [Poecilia reticulata]|uniref:interferon a3-like n=1 Tax=Poecilia reticulata TaxID=8081 RepID=UPI0007EAA394|nr:PREDICTED: interferon a3-like [Poecilia reticulata]